MYQYSSEPTTGLASSPQVGPAEGEGNALLKQILDYVKANRVAAGIGALGYFLWWTGRKPGKP